MDDIQRIDYSKPPPGYVVRFEDSSMENGDGPPLWWYGDPHYKASMGTETEALAAAWAHYKVYNDRRRTVAHADVVGICRVHLDKHAWDERRRVVAHADFCARAHRPTRPDIADAIAAFGKEIADEVHL